MVRALICGDRNWTDRKLIKDLVATFPRDTVVIHGAARGADSIAGEAALERGLEVEPYPADWDHKGRAAGPIRNRQMLKEGRPNVVYAFHDNLAASRGTADMVAIARKAGVAVFLISHGMGEPREFKKLDRKAQPSATK